MRAWTTEGFLITAMKWSLPVSQFGHLLASTANTRISRFAQEFRLGISGLALAVWGSRLLESQLYRVPSLDPPVFLGAAGVLLILAGIASLLPGSRAARTAPAVALRQD